jgi:membrane protease subunit (stomatin/prohibitin family)
MLPFWENLGLELTKFYVTSIEIDSSTEVGRRVLDAISRQSAQFIGGYTWQQEKTFDVAKNAIDGLSNSNSGIIGAVIAANMMGGLGGASSSIMQPQYNQPTFGGTNQGQQGGLVQSTNQVKDVYCSNCSKKFPSTYRFCPHCGDPYDACPKCGTDNDKNAKRCVNCGTPLQVDTTFCTNCSAPITPGSSFCGNCGMKQAEDKCTRCGTALSPTIKFCPKCGQKR